MNGPAEIIVVTNRKGGTGKTTTSVNLAAEFAAQGQPVLLIDMDTQGHCAVGVDVTKPKDSPTVHNLFLSDDFLLAEAVCPTAWPNLHLIPANPLFEHGSGDGDQTRLARALHDEGLTKQYDLIIIDTPPSFDGLLMNALCAARSVLIPFVPHHLSGEGIRNLARILFRVASGPNPDLKLLGLLPIMLDRRIGQHRNVTDGAALQFGQGRMLSGIRTDIKLAESFAHRQPVRSYMPNCRGTEDYAMVAREIGERLKSRYELHSTKQTT
ncbi:chromosome partitioning protein [Geoalkalibacter ferrihydriticus]|uniref:Chromosome partitioning protein n=2 Tax=Geoalkalibacter ferrihydriticus TaxID=392333 RepID=A0A0C2EF47_9BACT|nr:ParA family protein [Geoalkalibacter ferrihydriticus]KIH77228.1 chromosome partitioning protein [Geoalkalibacter ferrihydriticus DSM 17813]SDM24489.1 chromosome partitioning protein [Geoalkalibacter ferrihydriticus]